MNLTKGSFFFFNLLQFGAGIAVIVTSIVSLNQYHDDADDHLYPTMNTTLAALGVTTGIVTLIFTALGCVGAYKEKNSILFVYGGLECGMVLAQIILCVFLMVYVEKMTQHEVLTMQRRFKDYAQVNKSMDTFVDDFQEANSCCGINGYEEWEDYPYNGVADGCCVNRRPHCGYLYFTNPDFLKPKIWETGCFFWAERTANNISNPSYILGIDTGVVALLQVICPTIAFTLGYQIMMSE